MGSEKQIKRSPLRNRGQGKFGYYVQYDHNSRTYASSLVETGHPAPERVANYARQGYGGRGGDVASP